MTTLALLSVAVLFGGMVAYSFGFAAFLFNALPPETAGATLRRAFPHFYVFVIIFSALGAALVWPKDELAATILLAIAMTTIPTRQMLMPAINRATDAGEKRRFATLHGLSVLITIAHILAAAVVLSRFVQ